MPFPHFDFYPTAWLAGKNGLKTLEEQGAHMRLLALMWQLSSATEPPFLPDDNRELAQAVGVTIPVWSRLRKALVDGPTAVLQTDGVRIFSPRLTVEWHKACDRATAATVRSQKAQASVRQRAWRAAQTEDQSNDSSTDQSNVQSNDSSNVQSRIQSFDSPNYHLALSTKALGEKELVADEPQPSSFGKPPRAKVTNPKAPKHAVTPEVRALTATLAEKVFGSQPLTKGWRSANLQCLAKQVDRWGIERVRACANWMWQDPFWREQFDAWMTLERAYPQWLLKHPEYALSGPDPDPGGVRPSEWTQVDGVDVEWILANRGGAKK